MRVTFSDPVVDMVCCGRNPENDGAVYVIVAYRNGSIVLLPPPHVGSRTSADHTASLTPTSLPVRQEVTLSDICLSPNQNLLAGYSRNGESKEVTIWSSNYAFQGKKFANLNTCEI